MGHPTLKFPFVMLVVLLPSLVKTRCPSECQCYRDIANCENQFLKTIPTGFGAGTRRIYLGANLMQSIHKSHLPDLPALEILGFQNNQLTYIEDGAFSGYPLLTQLHLNNNFLRHINNATFTGLQSVRILTLHNQLTSGSLCIEDDAFSHMPILNELNLQNNNLKQITEKTFTGFQSGALYLQEQDIKKLSPEAFRHIRSDASILMDSSMTSRLCCCQSQAAIMNTTLSLNCVKNGVSYDLRTVECVGESYCQSKVDTTCSLEVETEKLSITTESISSHFNSSNNQQSTLSTSPAGSLGVISSINKEVTSMALTTVATSKSTPFSEISPSIWTEERHQIIASSSFTTMYRSTQFSKSNTGIIPNSSLLVSTSESSSYSDKSSKIRRSPSRENIQSTASSNLPENQFIIISSLTTIQKNQHIFQLSAESTKSKIPFESFYINNVESAIQPSSSLTTVKLFDSETISFQSSSWLSAGGIQSSAAQDIPMGSYPSERAAATIINHLSEIDVQSSTLPIKGSKSPTTAELKATSTILSISSHLSNSFNQKITHKSTWSYRLIDIQPTSKISSTEDTSTLPTSVNKLENNQPDLSSTPTLLTTSVKNKQPDLPSTSTKTPKSVKNNQQDLSSTPTTTTTTTASTTTKALNPSFNLLNQNQKVRESSTQDFDQLITQPSASINISDQVSTTETLLQQSSNYTRTLISDALSTRTQSQLNQNESSWTTIQTSSAIEPDLIVSINSTIQQIQHPTSANKPTTLQQNQKATKQPSQESTESNVKTGFSQQTNDEKNDTNILLGVFLTIGALCLLIAIVVMYKKRRSILSQSVNF